MFTEMLPYSKVTKAQSQMGLACDLSAKVCFSGTPTELDARLIYSCAKPPGDAEKHGCRVWWDSWLLLLSVCFPSRDTVPLDLGFLTLELCCCHGFSGQTGNIHTHWGLCRARHCTRGSWWILFNLPNNAMERSHWRILNGIVLLH